ncbi:MAG: type III-B CRISPR module RAMP protein Cmr4 [Phaeodactylibacter sp.]|nr:type III-B CRISPR module RAMP protein Cmr4 [Phaeodactylibacter sp.]MCB9052474.1 type III-B CRISPR module RAMP protein Cmr4 [Lewinellaceae bacterium]
MHEMNEKMTPFFLRTLSSLHAGSGDDNGLVDLPIQRELVTGYPKIEASTLKGALRSRVEQLAKGDPVKHTKIHLVFGYDDKSEFKGNDSFSGVGDKDNYAQQFMGALTFTDARLLLFPVRAMRGVFAQVTCPYVLQRLAEDLELGEEVAKIFKAADRLFSGNAEQPAECLTNAGQLQHEGKVILEEYVFKVKTPGAAELANAFHKATGLDSSRLVVLPDDVFSDFTQLFTERMTRNKIEDGTGVVADGGLFTEEYLPPEAVLYSLLLADKPRQPQGEDRKKLPDKFEDADAVHQFITQDCWNGQAKKILQIGGNATVGKGIVELHFPKL